MQRDSERWEKGNRKNIKKKQIKQQQIHIQTYKLALSTHINCYRHKQENGGIYYIKYYFIYQSISIYGIERTPQKSETSTFYTTLRLWRWRLTRYET